ncbi:hypothetical protein NKT34_25725 [Paenibacillus polysaccharolyticus]|uniref:hypothetical protein n=1 Tax=Paenibacillus polysaccharolyticus TaxID=582692 RepID=UPI00209EBE3B|nr:hypothetical protein [Paenibacillus polysaccharolyticus]MCP1136673.1 hypothetical protein [Paenibacillus polysaccharolyticus]
MTENLNLHDYSFEELLFKLSLYRKLNVDISNYTSKITLIPWGNNNETEIKFYETHYPEDFKHLVDFLEWEKKFYGYCTICRRETSLEPSPYKLNDDLSDSELGTYREDEEESYKNSDHYMNSIKVKMIQRVISILEMDTIIKELKCSHDPNHKSFFIFKLTLNEKKNDLEIQKIGQYPSMSEFIKPELEKYKKIMKKLECHEDFLNASKMNATGVAIAAYTYLRRVFEKLINRVFKDNQERMGRSEKEFKDMQMKQKINLLKEFLPTFLTDNKSNIYGLLSAGIHELDEKEASAMYPVLEQAILIIFKQIQDKIDNQLQEQKTKNAINNFATKLKS